MGAEIHTARAVKANILLTDNVSVRVYTAEDERRALGILRATGREETPANLLQALELLEPAEERTTRNLFTTAGKNAMRNLVGYPKLEGSVPGYTPDYLGVGTGTTAAAAADTALVAESTPRLIITQRRPPAAGQIEWKLVITTAQHNGSGSQDLAECGLFDLQSSGTLWARATFTPVTKTSAVTLTITWTLTLTPV